MKQNLTTYLLAAAMILFIAACKKPFTPDVPNANLSLLVVEGVIGNGIDSTVINLSRTVNISADSSAKPELNAVLTVEDEQSTVYTLTELGKGKYAAPAPALNSAKKYRLRIKTKDGQVYLSSAEVVKNAPPIDTVMYKTPSDGLAISINTHDPSNNTRYYRWQYEETWKIEVPLVSNFITDGTKLIPRTQSVVNCYGGHKSTNIIMASNTRLSQDVIADQAITVVPPTSEKLDKRYSILVKQYALTQAAYEFWTNMKKNTESLGGVFDQQPSAPTGNIRCITDPSLPVVGYISVGAVQTKRIFVDKAQLPALWKYTSPYGCSIKTYLFDDPVERENTVERDLVPLNSFYSALDSVNFPGTRKIAGYTGTSIYCADCTTKGIVPKPAFWK